MNGIALLVSTVRITMPYASGALGGTCSERGGVVNIALEGLMLGGAFAFVAVSWWAEKHLGISGIAAPLLGLLAAMLTGFALSLIHALASVTFKVDQIISGLAINIFSLGATNFLLKHIFNSASNSDSCITFRHYSPLPPKSALAPFNQLIHPLIFLTLIAFIFVHILFYRTRFGLRLRAVGENPAAADSLGVSVSFYRYAGVLIGGVIASIGGVWLAADQGRFISSMTNGRGYIALAAMIIGNWKPAGAAAACVLFGFAEAMQNQLQIFQQTAQNAAAGAMNWFERIAAVIPTQLIQALPYILTIIVIAGFFGKSSPPAADGIPYDKEAA
jgi:simple sugar transport system permease protein